MTRQEFLLTTIVNHLQNEGILPTTEYLDDLIRRYGYLYDNTKDAN